MIKSVTIHKGKGYFTNKLYHHTNKDVTYTFTDGVNVITGRNGCGKSVLLKIVKTNCGISKDDTYPRFPHPMEIGKGWDSDEKLTIDELIESRLEKTNLPKSSIDWTGTMVHYLTPDYFDSKNLWESFDTPYPKGKSLYGAAEILNDIFESKKTSAGEKCVKILSKLVSLHTDYDEPFNANDTWKYADNLFREWVNNKPQIEKPTLLIDELDQHLDLDNQKFYWDYINGLTQKWQVIVVSHSVFAFLRNDVNHIPLSPKYFKDVRKIFNK